MTKPLRSWQLLRQKFVRDRSALSGLVILIGLVIPASGPRPKIML
jgi:hypothetical protein